MDDLAFRPARELAAAVRRRDVSARELAEHHLRRIERHDPAINAVVTLDAERALATADDLDRRLAAGADGGPLAGVPMTIKDQWETAGLRTTCGAAIWAEHVPETDAVAVGRLRAAGAVVLGKTNVPPFAGDWQTENELFGRTGNPWDPSRTPFGSSGGAAAAVAAGLAALELGGDIGGSIRLPAHACGIYGHKPTHGIVPPRGCLPAPPGSRGEPDIAVGGPLARSADDLEVALDVLAGPDEWAAAGWRLELPPPRATATRELRVAVWADDGVPIDEDVRGAVEAAAAALERAGARVDRRPDLPLSVADAHRLRQELVYPLIASRLDAAATADARARLGALREGEDSREARRLRWGLQSHAEWLAANERRQQVRLGWARFFRDHDVLLCPPGPVPALPHDERPMDDRTFRVAGETVPWEHLGRWISLAGTALLPSTVAPAGRTRDGLPVGVEIVGPYLEDRTTIDVARRLAELVGGFEPPPAFRD